MNIGVDIGGRHVGIGLVNEEGKIINKSIVELNDDNKTPEYIFNAINEYIENTTEKIDSIGIGVPGICNETTIEYMCNLPFSKIDVREYIKARIPVYLGNDAVCAALAEYTYEDHRMYTNYMFVTLGTGIGAGIILDGKLYNGSTGSAGEVGHMVIDKGGIECSCGRRGCFEKYASVSALLRRTDVESLTELFYLVERNEKIAKIFDSYLEDLADGLANLINIYDVEMIVIGGSIAWFGKKFLHTLKSKLSPKIFNKETYDLNIKCAKLGNDAGVIGATLLKEYI